MPTRALGVPSARQELFLRAKNRFVAYGGARGGGKSWAVRFKAQVMAVRWPGIRILILRRTLPELQENHICPLLASLYGIARYTDAKKTFSFPNGSVIRFGYCEVERDVLQYQGQEYDLIFIDEATHFTEEQFSAFKACNRGTNGYPKRIYLTCNPGGVGHAWVKRLFIDRDFSKGEDPDDYVFIPAKIYDNEALMRDDPDYLKNLQSLPEDLRRAWLDGDWDLFEGQYFTEFRREIHVCEPFYIPEHWRRYLALDYGLDMLACYWAAFDERGDGVVYRELYERNLIVREAAKRIAEYTGGEKLHARLAPSDLWGRSAETGVSQAERFAREGVGLSQVVQRDRIAGWMSLKEWIRPREDGTSALRIFSSCPNLIRCLPLLRHDPHRPNDCATEPHEITHAPDALRYLLAGRPVRGRLPEPENPFEPEYAGEEAVAMYGIE